MRILLFVILLALSGNASAHGTWTKIAGSPLAPIIAQPKPAPAAAPSHSATSAAFKAAQFTLAALVVYIAYCMATEDKDWCERQETPVFPQ